MSQEVTVLDESTLLPAKDVKFSSGEFSVLTDINGNADISSFRNSDKILITSSDYKDISTVYSEIEKLNFKLYLSPKSYTTDEIIISANKFDENSRFIPRQIDVINEREIEFSNTQTTAELLQNTGNVLVQKSQQGGGSPIIRGFEANKVLIMIDGIRLNNAIFRGGHLQNVIRIDENMLNRVEVIYGSGSTIYGSDALGGVMSFFSRDPELSSGSKTVFSGNAFLRYSSANTEKSGHFNFNIGGKKLGFLGSFTFKDFGSLRQGSKDVKNDAWLRKFKAERINGRDTMIATDDYFLQDPSGYDQYDVLGKFLYKPDSKFSHTLNFQFSNTNDVPRYDRLNTVGSSGNFTNAEWYYGPETRLLASYKLDMKSSGNLFDNSRILLAFQDLKESRINRSFQSANKNFREENVKVYSVNVDFSKNISMHKISYGLEGIYNNVNSTAYRININTGAESPQSTRYPDGGSSMTSFAAYISDAWTLNKTVTSTFGARYNYVGLKADFTDTTFFNFPFKTADQNSSAFSGNLGFTFNPDNDWKIYINGSSGFRAPNIDDLGKVFESVKGSANSIGTVIVPNPDLKPEYTYSAELGISKIINNRVKIEATGYYTILNDAIVTLPFKFNGQDTITYEGFPALVTANQNAQDGFIYGMNAGIFADLTDNLSLTGTINYTYGRIKTDSVDYPLDHIPPLFGKSALILSLNKFKGEFNVLFNAWKLKKDYNLFGEDNFSDATPDGMPAWYTLNLSTSYQFSSKLRIQIDINNLLDRNYRVFASGISAPGINSVVSLRGNF